jgi:hypothetical protein
MNKTIIVERIEDCDVSKLNATVIDTCDGFYYMRIYYGNQLIMVER